MIKNFNAFKKSLQDGREVYYRGKLVKDVTKHPITKLEVAPVEALFDEQYWFNNPDYGCRTSRFWNIPRNSADLLERSKITYEITKELEMLWPHIGSDCMLALRVSTNTLGGVFKERYDAFAKHVITNNLWLACAQIDSKGDRRFRPAEQPDPDQYVHVVQEKKDGIVVRGAKLHTSMTAIANEIVVCPGRAFKEGDEDYAIAFAVPPNTKGLKLIMRPGIASEGAKHQAEGPRANWKRMGESMTVFDNVFVPWERVFVYKDLKAASGLALLFALFHRLSAVSYRTALAEHFIGMGKLIAEANGVDRAPHIARDITDLIVYTEIQRACSRMACYECHIDKRSGVAIPNNIYTNAGKLYSNSNYMKVMNSLIDIAGGVACTAPSGEDYANKDLRPLVKKYMTGAVSGEERFKLMLLIREQIALLGGEEAVIYIHAEGSQEASIVELYRSYNYTETKEGIKKMLDRMVF